MSEFRFTERRAGERGDAISARAVSPGLERRTNGSSPEQSVPGPDPARYRSPYEGTEDIRDWEERLRWHGLVPTPIRSVIAAHLLPHARHITADGLHAELERIGHRISRTRVSDTLREFVRWDLLQAIDVGGGLVFYDTVTWPHAHVFNVDTGEIEDLASSPLWVTALPELPDGVRIDSVQMVFRVRQADIEG